MRPLSVQDHQYHGARGSIPSFQAASRLPGSGPLAAPQHLPGTDCTPRSSPSLFREAVCGFDGDRQVAEYHGDFATERPVRTQVVQDRPAIATTGSGRDCCRAEDA